jgi:integrase
MAHFGELLDDFIAGHVPNLAAPTRARYLSNINRHIRPAFGDWPVDHITTKAVDKFLADRAAAGLSWESRMSLRVLLCTIFNRAEKWGTFSGTNPALHSVVGRKRSAREKRKLSVEQTLALILALPEDLRPAVILALSCGLRISEVLGLCWKHIDFDRGMVMIRQRYWRGDLDIPKTQRSERDVPLGYLCQELRAIYPGAHVNERFIFSVRTRGRWDNEKTRGVTRDDRSIRRYFLRPAAKKLGIYHVGFGFHSFRREAITAIAAKAGFIQAMRVAGQVSASTTMRYGLDQYAEQESAIRAIQQPLVDAGLLSSGIGS